MAHEVVAQAILREVPLQRIKLFINEFGDPNPVANGDACGNGCGSVLDGFGLTFDRFGHGRIDARELEAAHDDVDGLSKSLQSEVMKFFE